MMLHLIDKRLYETTQVNHLTPLQLYFGLLGCQPKANLQEIEDLLRKLPECCLSRRLHEIPGMPEMAKHQRHTVGKDRLCFTE
jgi:hypothetical protein